MMPANKLVAMVLRNTVRSKRHFILSAFGIVIGSCAFTSSIALTQKAGNVLENVFPIEEVEIVTPRVSTFGKDTSKKLDDAVVQMILARPEVKSAVPRMNLAFPAAGRGDFEGTDLKFEVGVSPTASMRACPDGELIRDLFKVGMSQDPAHNACRAPRPIRRHGAPLAESGEEADASPQAVAVPGRPGPGRIRGQWQRSGSGSATGSATVVFENSIRTPTAMQPVLTGALLLR
jgi:hypothetical protein